ncbi:RNA-dependent ATPase rok1 [Taxawa tesnikishii (nom. ined.)]|nr:RNA-dependent ATPase rok1 [Dothideales sp. JES 119]
MDPLRLLTRSTRISKGPRAHKTDAIPSKGRAQNPQLFGAGTTGSDSSKEASQSRKRKRGSRDIAEESTNARELDFFGGGNLRDENKDALEERRTGNRQAQDGEHRQQDGRSVQPGQDEPAPTEEERRRVLAQHKIKVTLLEEVQEEAPQKRRARL